MTQTLVDRILANGDRLYEEGELDAALAEYSRATLLAPRSTIAFMKCGSTYLKKAAEKGARDEFKEDARRNYAKAVEINPALASAHYGLGRACFELKACAAAVKAYKTAIRIDENFVDARFQLAETFYQAEKYPKATLQFEKIISLSSPAAIALRGRSYYRLGNILMKENHIEEALNKYQLAHEAGLRDSVIFYNLGVVLKQLDRVNEAITNYQKAIKLDDPETRYAAHNNVGRIYDELYRDQEALEAFEMAAAEGSDCMAIALNNWGNVLVRLRRYREACEKYEESIKCNCDYAKAYYNRAFLLWQQGKHKEARKAWKEALDVFDKHEVVATDPEHFRLSGSIRHEIFQEEARAEKTYMKALDKSNENLDVLLNLVTLFVQQRDAAIDVNERNDAQVKVDTHFRKAERILNKLLQEAHEKRKDDSALHIIEGKLYQAVKEYTDATKAYLKALEVLQNSGKSLDLQAVYAGLGNCCIQQDEYKKAAEYLEQALLEDPDDLFVKSRLAEAYRKMNEFTRAERKYVEVFNVSKSHVESYLGWAELYKMMGDNGDVEMYEDAIRWFSDALVLSKSEEGSKVLRGKELADLFYLRGYASVKSYENSRPARGESLLRAALSDFEISYQKDKNNFRAKRAAEKLRLRLSYTRSQSILKSVGPIIIFLVSAFVFGFTQYCFFTGKPIGWDDTGRVARVMSESHYALLTFGSIIFMIAGLSLPELLKIKIAGVELEKISIEQVQPFSSLGISKGTNP